MSNFNYKIEDTNKGVFATVTLPEGIFKMEIKQLPYNRITGNRRIFQVVGNTPENYSISYENGKLFVFKKENKDWSEGQKVEHKVFGKGTITKVMQNALSIDFNGEQKSIIKSIATNFLK